MSSDIEVAGEVDRLFEILEDSAGKPPAPAGAFRTMLVSPVNTRDRVLALLDREQRKGTDGYVLFKVNHLTDKAIVRKIREATDAGVQMDHIVRTTYSVLPHENIRAISIVDRYLEHQRVYIFGRGDERLVFMSSADLMERNLDHRIEVGFPIRHPELQQQLIEMMVLQVADTCKARVLDETQSNRYVGDGAWSQRAQYKTYKYLQNLYDRLDAVSNPAQRGHEQAGV